MAELIIAHFRDNYKPFADDMYELHRCNLVHSWNLFEAAVYPDYTTIKLKAGVLGFRLSICSMSGGSYGGFPQ